MTNDTNDLPGVLRRRAQAFMDDDHYSASFVAPLLRAADEIEIRRKATTEDEQMAVDAIFDNRRLRRGLQQVYGMVRGVSMSKVEKGKVLEVAGNVLKATSEKGLGRKILNLEIGPAAVRADIEAKLHDFLEAAFPSTGSDTAHHAPDGDSRPVSGTASPDR